MSWGEHASSSKRRGTGAVSLTLRPDAPTDIDELPEPSAWVGDALCAQTDPEAFFPEKGGSTRDAKTICRVCEVREQCLEYALEHDERFGIWGGLSERERRKFKKAATGGDGVVR